MWNDTHSFRFRLWMTMVAFAVFLCGLLWVLQLTAIQTNYEKDRTDALRRSGNSISNAYGSPAFDETLRSVARSGGFFVQSLTEDGVLLRTIGNDGQDAPPPQDDLVDYNIFERLDHTDGYYVYQVPDTVHNSKWIVQAQVVANWNGVREVLFTSTSMTSVDEVIDTLTSRFLLVSALLLAIATVLALFLAQRLSKPLMGITEKARRLAREDYSVDFSRQSHSCTELDQLSDTLNTAAQEFQRTETLRRDLIANVSHDMRTPLTKIKAYAEMVQQISGNDPVKREAHLEVIVREADKLTRFINETMDLSRLQSGTMELNMAVFPLARCVENALEDFRHLWEGGGYRVFLSLDNGLTVRGDERQLERAVYNLISNALSYTGEDKTVYAGVSLAGDEVLFEVIDTGKGIDDDKLYDIWTRYYKINRYDEKASSTGIGLSIVKAILELHHARYGTDSRPGEGTRFWFAMPFC